ncbi:putative secreted protein (Por secretion system target) [Neolewinella xylanilytica]|uniref:Putative secreted protein (Por secretion system target) n=1 Tax=Neolewinella xylanilytica TaxID=1514080 RepID=A0A2S6IBN7_9BACT|nr:choice-of-anchor V domain-containing protein [Neolewinella xylanilytica]PPK88927.1 putative secreted protein (Por secretion system target) [Neolewinella xylanilytica]
MPRFTTGLPFFLVAASILLAGYSSGPASSEGAGFTGAPSAGGGTEGICANCHFSGDFGSPRLQATFADMPGNAYRPGQTYTVTVSVQAEMGTPSGYGFQAQFLDQNDPIRMPAGTLSDPDDVTQIATTSSGRTYAEHKGINPDSLFTFHWTAPEAGTGPVSFYLAGNTVNRADGQLGDNGSREPLLITLSEDTSTGLFPTAPDRLTTSVSPNPTFDQSRVSFAVERSGAYRFDLVSADGRLLTSATNFLVAGPHSIPVNLVAQPAGIYYYRIAGSNTAATVKIHRR